MDDLVAASSRNGHAQQAETEAALRERLAYYFLEWVRMYQMSPSPEQAFVAIVTNLQAQGILKGEEVTFLFFRVCAETALEGYAKSKAADPVAALVPLDALSKLFVLLLKNYGDPTGAEADESKVRYLNKILSIVVLVLVQSHEQLGHEFDQRPFFRFFSSILNDLHHIEPSIPTAYLGCLRAISSNTLSMLQPTLLPGFAFSWMSLISHHLFMPKILGADKDRVSLSVSSSTKLTVASTDFDLLHLVFVSSSELGRVPHAACCAVQVPVPVPYGAQDAGGVAGVLQGVDADPARSAARLPRVPGRVPPLAHRGHPAALHPVQERHPLGLPPEPLAPGPVHVLVR